jgi:hypothetical protein
MARAVPEGSPRLRHFADVTLDLARQEHDADGRNERFVRGKFWAEIAIPLPKPPSTPRKQAQFERPKTARKLRSNR